VLGPKKSSTYSSQYASGFPGPAASHLAAPSSPRHEGNIGQAPSLIHRRSRHIHDLILMLIHRHSQLARIIHDGSSRNFGVARDGLKAEVFGTSNPDPQPSAFGPRPSRLSQASAIAAEALMNNAG
jgi:hypothetical protein